MSVSIAAVLGEFKQIEQRSPEDVAVLMTPLLRALEAVRDGREPQLDHPQVMAIANSLAQTAAQAGDVDAAVAIATASAELEQLSPEAFAPRGDGAGTGAAAAAQSAPSATAAAPAERPLRRTFANPYHQLLGIIGVCGLSYAGYLEIQARIQPGSVAGWLLTGSSSLFALAVALAWRRFVVRRDRGPVLAVLALVFAISAAGWAVQTALNLRPQIATALHGAAPAASVAAAAAPNTAPEGSETNADATAAGRMETPTTAPIAFWMLGPTPTAGTTRMPGQTADAVVARASTGTDATRPQTEIAGARTAEDGGPAAALPLGRPSGPLPQVAARVANPPPRQPETPVERYRDLLEHEVVVVDSKGLRHEGKLTGVSNHGVTLLMEVELFGQPILAQRFYLFDSIEKLHAK